MEFARKLKSYLQLMPKEKELQAAWYEYRCKDVATMAKWFVLTSGIYVIMAGSLFFPNPSRAALIQFIPHIINFILRITIWILKDKFTMQVGYMFFTVMIFQLCHAVLRTPIAVASASEEELTLNHGAVLRQQFDLLMRYVAVNCFLAAPSVAFMHVYILAYLLAVLWLSLAKGDLDDALFI